MTVENLLSRLDKVQPKGKGRWMACCPAHDDRNPSLAVSELNDGRVLIKCFAGCPTVSVLSSVGLSMTDLFPNAPLGQFDGWFRLQRKVLLNQLEKEEAALSGEKLILEMAKQDRKNGKRLSPQDLERERQAYLKVRGAA